MRFGDAVDDDRLLELLQARRLSLFTIITGDTYGTAGPTCWPGQALSGSSARSIAS